MSRENKYRIWDNDNCVFDRIDFSDLEKTISTLDTIRDYFSSQYLKDNPEFLQKFTGLKDKKGKDWYDGDIVKTYEGGPPHKTFWDDKAMGWKIECITNGRIYNIHEGLFEIIGNIYENPELLNSEPTPEVSDTTKADSSTNAK
jgi:hypothetical protein